MRSHTHTLTHIYTLIRCPSRSQHYLQPIFLRNSLCKLRKARTHHLFNEFPFLLVHLLFYQFRCCCCFLFCTLSHSLSFRVSVFVFWFDMNTKLNRRKVRLNSDTHTHTHTIQKYGMLEPIGDGVMNLIAKFARRNEISFLTQTHHTCSFACLLARVLLDSLQISLVYSWEESAYGSHTYMYMPNSPTHPIRNSFALVCTCATVSE